MCLRSSTKVLQSCNLPVGHTANSKLDPLKIPVGCAEGLVSVVLCRLEHENGVVDLQGRTQLDVEDFNDVALVEEQESLAIDLLEVGNTKQNKD